MKIINKILKHLLKCRQCDKQKVYLNIMGLGTKSLNLSEEFYIDGHIANLDLLTTYQLKEFIEQILFQMKGRCEKCYHFKKDDNISIEGVVKCSCCKAILYPHEN